jgi:hypothetical protein
VPSWPVTGIALPFFFTVSSLDCLLMLHISLVRTKTEHFPVAWNFLTNTDSKKVESAQRKFSTSYYNIFFINHNSYGYNYYKIAHFILETAFFEPLLIRNFYTAFITYPSLLLETVIIRFPS